MSATGQEQRGETPEDPYVLWSDLLRVEETHCYVFVRIVQAGGDRVAVIITPSDNPGSSPGNRYEELLAELVAVFGATPDVVLIAFPEFTDSRWTMVRASGIEASSLVTDQQAGDLVGIHAMLPPPDACRCADLAPGHPLLAFLPDPEPERSLMQHLAAVDVASLPWPHKPFRCHYASRFEDLRRHYPSGASDTGAVGAHWSTTLTEEDVAACRYHQLDWEAATAAALEILESGAAATTEEIRKVIAEKGLSDELAEATFSFFGDPISWTPGTAHVTNGQHRLCAIRFAGVRRCVIDIGPSASAGAFAAAETAGSPREHAADAISAYWATRPTWVETHNWE